MNRNKSQRKMRIMIFIIYALMFSSESYADSLSCVDLFSKGAPLSEQQEKIIHRYTHGGYILYNNFLRGMKLREIQRISRNPYHSKKEFEVMVKELNSALRSLPPEKGVFFRSISIYSGIHDVLETYVPGKIVPDKAFVSMTDIKEGRGDHSETNILFKITTEQGRRVDYLSSRPYEKEVMLPSNQNFRVQGVRGVWIEDIDWNPKGKTKIGRSKFNKEVLKEKRRARYSSLESYFEELSPRDLYNKLRRGETPVIEISLEHLPE